VSRRAEARRHHRNVDPGFGQRAGLLVGDGPHAAAIGGKDRCDVGYAHHLELWRRSAPGRGDGLPMNGLQSPVSPTRIT
jgi:hypothetical protein